MQKTFIKCLLRTTTTPGTRATKINLTVTALGGSQSAGEGRHWNKQSHYITVGSEPWIKEQHYRNAGEGQWRLPVVMKSGPLVGQVWKEEEVLLQQIKGRGVLEKRKETGTKSIRNGMQEDSKRKRRGSPWWLPSSAIFFVLFCFWTSVVLPSPKLPLQRPVQPSSLPVGMRLWRLPAP